MSAVIPLAEVDPKSGSDAALERASTPVKAGKQG
jgi:hypothetical protein